MKIICPSMPRTSHTLVLTLLSLLLTFLTCVVLNSYIYLPFRMEDEDDEQDTERTEFRVAFYLGLGFGSAAGGALAYWLGPDFAWTLTARLAVACGLLSTALCSPAELGSTFDLLWFLLAFSSFSHFTVLFVRLLESVPGGRYRVYVGLGLLGLQWSAAMFYSLLVATTLDNWQARIFLNTSVLFCLFALQEMLPFGRLETVKSMPKENLMDILRSREGLRYLGCLLALWMLHGYVYYSNSHSLYHEGKASQFYACLTDGVSMALVMVLVAWTGQRRPVVSAMIFLTAICCFILYGVRDDCDLVDIFNQVYGFLVAGSMHVLWLLTAETFGPGVRYLMIGVCSLSARLVSLLASVVVDDTSLYLDWPCLVAGFACFACSMLIFFVPEPESKGDLCKETKRSNGRSGLGGATQC